MNDFYLPLVEGLKTLDSWERDLIYLRYYCHKSYEELAKKTHLSVEGIRKKLFKIQGKIRWAGKTLNLEEAQKKEN